MTINYTTLLGLAQPVTGTETGQWGDVVNDEITSLLEDAVANAATISVTSGNVTLTTTNGSSNQARMSTLIITGTPGTTRSVIAPSQSKIYVVINQSDSSVVIKGSATTGITVASGQTAQVAWNGSDFVEIGNYVNGNFVVNGTLTVNGVTTLKNNLLFSADNSYDIGASGATRPRNLFLGSTLNVGTTAGVGTAATTDVMLRIGGTPISGGASAYAFLSTPTFSGTATNAYGITQATVLDAGATFGNAYAFLATQNALGAGASLTNQYGFLAASTLTGATNNYGVASDIAAGTNRWNFYASGDAANYFAGSTTIGASSSYTLSLNARLNTSVQFAADGSYNIGGSTNYRPAYVYVASQVNVGSALNNSSYGLLSNAPLSATTSFTTYTADGLYGATALPSRLSTPGNSYLLFGYGDAAGGQYWPRVGFQNGSSCSVQAKNSIGNDNNGDFWIGTGTGNTEALRILASDQSVHVGSTYSTVGLSGGYLTASSVGLGNQSGDNSYLRRQASGIYAWQTTIGGSNVGSLELQPAGGYVGIGTGGSGSSYPLEIYYSNNALAYGEKISSSTDYNGMVLGAATEYGSNNSAVDKWYMIWRGRTTGNGHAFRLYDALNNKDAFNMTPGISWSLVSSTNAGSYLKQISAGDLGISTEPTTNPVNPYPGFNFQGGGMVSPQVYDMCVHKNVLYSSGWKFTQTGVRGAILFVQNGYFTWSGTTATGTAGGAATLSDYMVLNGNKNLAVGSSTTTGSSGADIARIYAGTGYGGGGASAIAQDQLGGNGFARTIYFADGTSGTYSKIKVQINLQGAGGWCIQLNTGGTGGGAHLIAGGYINGPGNFSLTTHASSGTWVNAAVTDNIFYIELQSNVGTHPCITGSITGSLNHNFTQNDITVTFS